MIYYGAIMKSNMKNIQRPGDRLHYVEATGGAVYRFCAIRSHRATYSNPATVCSASSTKGWLPFCYSTIISAYNMFFYDLAAGFETYTTLYTIRLCV